MDLHSGGKISNMTTLKTVNQIRRHSMLCSAVLLLLMAAIPAFPQSKDDLIALQAEPVTASKVQFDFTKEGPTETKNPATVPQQTSTSTAPLTAGQKLRFGFREAFLNPFSYAGPAIGAFVTERNNVKAPGKSGEDNFADGASYFARDFASNATTEIFSAGVFPALFKQDPRYFRSNKHGFGSRAAYAASRTLITRNDKGQTEFNYSNVLGSLTSATLANVYERNTLDVRDRFGRPIEFNRRVGVGPTFERFGLTLAFEAASNVAFGEFDVIGKLRRIFKH